MRQACSDNGCRETRRARSRPLNASCVATWEPALSAPRSAVNRETPTTLAGSRAFRDAALRSEERRAQAVIGLLILLVLVVLTRDVSQEVHYNIRLSAVLGI